MFVVIFFKKEPISGRGIMVALVPWEEPGVGHQAALVALWELSGSQSEEDEEDQHSQVEA